MLRTDANVDSFLASLDGPYADTMRSLDALIAPVFEGYERMLWEGVFWGGTEQQIIGYGGVVQSRPRGKDVEWFLVGLAAQKEHVSVYVNAADGKEYLTQQWASRLGKVKVGSAAVTIRSLDGVDLDELRALVARALKVTANVS